MSTPSAQPGDEFARAAFQLYPLLVGGLLHDVNNSLALLVAAMELAKLGRDEVVLKMIKDGTMSARIQHIARVVSVIHELSRRFYARGAGERAPQDEINDLVKDQEQQHPKVRFEPRVECAPDRLQLPGGLLTFLLGEVLKNAAQACDGRPEALVSVSLTVTPDQRTFSLACRDNGPGFTPQHLARIQAGQWQLPRNLDQGGFGLYLMHEIVARLGGQLLISNLEPNGNGARVEVLLPVRHESAP